MHNHHVAPTDELDEQISEAVSAAREERLREEGIEGEETSDLDEMEINYRLLGHCHENSIALAEELKKREIPCDIVWGWKYRKGDGQPETVEEAEKKGLTHFWVEVCIDDVRVAEIATEQNERLGEAVLFHDRPARYNVPEKARFEYENTMSSNDLLPGKVNQFREQYEPVF